ncbi:MAG: EF-P beta-lysylation protein EpmB [Gammaproteobacteria bacterium]|nr:EF-P beta-lysylation protein EpmB [Gammaproteobacteria bacterium]
MIHQANLSVESQWQKELKQSYTKPKDLLNYLNLPVADFEKDFEARKLFNMRVPRYFASLMEKGNPNDPLFLQVMPQIQEFIEKAGYEADPLKEHDSEMPGLLHKYKSRVLIMFRTGCAVNCRYCFRREFPYADNAVNKEKLTQVLDYISQNKQINEVILSGGDPLMANDQAIAWFVEQCESISHLKRLRIHTRLPVVMPSRVTKELIDSLQQSRLKAIVVLHINHHKEISEQLILACSKLNNAGITLFNQAVLLKNINDTVHTQVLLAERLFDSGILPYYLHLLDKVTGVTHFNLTEAESKKIYEGMLAELPGFLVPKLVREVGGESSKTPVLP